MDRWGSRGGEVYREAGSTGVGSVGRGGLWAAGATEVGFTGKVGTWGLT